jgi:hypothetical protein
MQMTIPNNKKKKSNFTEIITPSIKETSLLSTRPLLVETL